MALQRQVKKIGGSLGIIIPKDYAQDLGFFEGSPLKLSISGRQMIVEAEDEGGDYISDEAFNKSFRTVLRKYGSAFKALAEYDAGHKKKP
jgi:hypothetical protein